MTTKQNMSASAMVQVRPKDTITILKGAIQHRLPVMISGAPGVGKTALAEQAAREAHCALLKIFPVICDPTDVKGLPIVVDGKAEFSAFGDLRQLIEAKNPLVCIIDDLGQAAPVIQASLMQIVLAREIAGNKISDCVTFIACTNRRQDRAAVSGILEPLKSRFATILELTPNYEDWVTWANANNIDYRVVAFIRQHPDLLHDFHPTADMTNSPCPRTIEHVSQWMQLGYPYALLQKIIAGAAGDAFAIAFGAFLNVITEVPDLDAVIEDPNNAPVPKRPDSLYAVCGALSRRVTSKKIMEKVMTYIERLAPEFQTIFIMDAKQLYPEVVLQSGRFIDWVEKNSDMII